MLNLSPLFFTTLDAESCMHDELDLTPEQRAWIASARTDVRDCLRKGIPRVLRASGYTEDVPQPRFFTQGSWAYKTLNSPARHPQQADVDDGCYLPMSFVSQTRRPSTAAMVFFTAAEEALKPLVEERRSRKGGGSLSPKSRPASASSLQGTPTLIFLCTPFQTRHLSRSRRLRWSDMATTR